jgi:hypothetical protein
VEKQVNVLGMKQTPATEFEIVANFSSKPYITSSWQLNTLTNAEGFSWITQPKLSLGGISLPITTLVETIIRNNQSSIARLIDQKVKEEIDLSKQVLGIWNSIKEPVKVSDEYNIWVYVVPLDVLMTELKNDKTKIVTSIAFKANIHSSVGKADVKPEKSAALPPIKFVNSLPEECRVHLFNLITFTEAEKIARDVYLGEKFDLGSGRFMEITGVRIFGGANNKLQIEINSVGDINGTVFLNGDPVYDENRRELVLKNTQFDLKTKSVLKKAASWVLNGKVEKMIEKDFGIPVDPIFESARTATSKAINTRLWRGVQLQGNISSIQPGKVYLEPGGLMTTLEVKGKLGVKL